MSHYLVKWRSLPYDESTWEVEVCQTLYSSSGQINFQKSADFSRGMHWCATQELTGLCSSSTTVVSYDLVVSHTKLLLIVLHLAF